ncbi:hypothetical protein L226DRAFT_609442 [Lentinus tigrinus ALCF2SS1-7]|uniref:RING-type domain-containing protein n=1 Tax=Lentinus tigrinus ALCF2SS1-6 TaxID=1328759 RepID=A0A5C2SRY9_9APHY|nr:hypothetical protein L227DRAFT_649325 [Lentinus tigrinus ALCF2SS1-6]RPD80584.1 hypothetical protein L226DRAFT_609442 [Lentinus tigrinus ALCF2SS1-7]
MTMETAVAPAQCKGCSGIFQSKNQAEDHARRAGHLTPKCIVRICTECKKTFARNEDQQQHVKATGHMQSGIPSGPNGYPTPSAPVTASTGEIFVCENCHSQFPNAGVLASHRKHAHGASPSALGAVSKPACPTCFTQFSTNAEQVEHVTTTLACSACKICLQPGQALADHYWDSVRHPSCRPCVKGFEDEAAYTAHKKICPIAPTKTNNKQAPATAAPKASTPSTNTPSPCVPQTSMEQDTPRKSLWGSWTRKANGEDNTSLVTPKASVSTNRAPSPALSQWGSSFLNGSGSDSSPSSSVRGTPKSTSSGSTTSGRPAQRAAPWVFKEPSPSEWESPIPKPASLAPLATAPERSNGSSPGEATSAADMLQSTRGSSNKDDNGSVAESAAPTVTDTVARPAYSSVGERVHDLPTRMPNTQLVKEPLKHSKSQPSVNPYSWHCRLCMQDPCVDPVTTICGHLLCLECAMREMKTSLGCPVCKKVFLVRLQV